MPATVDGLRLRPATLHDAELLADIGARTFRDTFGPENKAEDIEAHLAEAYTAVRFRREIGRTDYAHIIAEVNGVSAGFAVMCVHPAPPCVAAERPVELLRFYLERDWHGKGIAQTLMDAAVAEAQRRGGDVLWLGVWERNPRAIRFYEKVGFRDVGSQTFQLGRDLQRDRVLARGLRLPGSDQAASPGSTVTREAASASK